MPREVRDLEAIEAIIDEKGMDGLLDVIADVCAAKAKHIFYHWQDPALSETWNRAMVVVQGMKENRAIRGVIPRR